MLVSWVQQVSFEPLAVSIAVAKDRPIFELIRRSGRLGLSIVPEADKSLMKRYARGVKPGDDPFHDTCTIRTPAGVPVFAEALAWIECQSITESEFGGDHILLIARVTAAELLGDGAPFTHVRGSGLHY